MWKGSLSIFLAFVAFCISLKSVSQQSYSKTRQLQHVVAYEVNSQDSSFVFKTDHPFSALVIKSEILGSFSVILDGSTLLLPKDEDVESPTYFLSLPQKLTEIVVVAPPSLSFELFAIQSGTAPSLDDANGRISKTLDCQDPIEFIPQSTWRSGLQAPNYSRSFHQVFHNVVHHAAGSNTNTNYTQVVRDIYLYHTQVNGWSDIGYNYLISQDGTIYAGRDPDGGSQDNVRGAHFCGANSGTLGVCLLGNYETTTPTSSTWSSLEQLLTYQLLNQELDPFDSFSHPNGQLAAVIGHRDGCSTLCPGENVYRQLETLRSSLADLIQDCLTPDALSFEVESSLLVAGKSVTFTNTSSGYDSYRWNLEGAFPSQVEGLNATVKYSVPGFYDVMLIGSEGNKEDTLLLEAFMQVSLLRSSPTIFPNPAQGNDLLHVDFEDEIRKVRLFETNGKLIGTWEATSNFRVPQLRSGLYLLTIESNERSYEKKLLVK